MGDRARELRERHREYVQTDIGTAVVETPKRVKNPVTDETRDLTQLSRDGYCRRFLALLSARNSPDVINLNSSPVATFDKERWQLEETEEHYVLQKTSAETHLDEVVLTDDGVED